MPNDLADAPLARQIEALGSILASNPVVSRLLAELPKLALPSWYVGGGGIAQTVWNRLHGFEPAYGITDYDVVYFDPHDLTAGGEQAVEAAVASLVPSAGDAKVDVTNEARAASVFDWRATSWWCARRSGSAICSR